MTSKEWVVLELNPKGEKEDPDVLRGYIGRSIKSEIFIPAYISVVGGDKVVKYLVDGYIFIERNQPDYYYFRLENTRYINTVLTRPSHIKVEGRSVKELSCVPCSEIEKIRGKISSESKDGIGIGDSVTIMSGPYKGIKGTVVEDITEEEKVQVYVKLRSKEVIVTLPRGFLSLYSKAEVAPTLLYTDLSSAARSWYNDLYPILNYSDKESKGLQRRFSDLQYMIDLETQKVKTDHTIHNFEEDSYDAVMLEEEWDHFRKLSAWSKSYQSCSNFIRGFEVPLKMQPMVNLKNKLQKLSLLENKLNRIEQGLLEVDRVLSLRDESMENVIIDGHNLAMRCFYAIGPEKMSSGGKSTGMIYGFLKSLAAFKRRFNNAQIWVCWDGSSKKRKAMYTDYKANREKSDNVFISTFNQFAYLKEILPSLGVNQATNPLEEADDLIATLVRGPLKGQKNIIISTDRDFMQLVTATDVVLVPKVGARPEKIFDELSVLDEYGVEPDKMVQLRALQGDTSDNIPGVPKVPGKVFLGLLKSYGDIDGIYQSNLAGLTKLQFEKVKESEGQVRLNVKLMALQDVPYDLAKANANFELADASLKELNIKTESLINSFSARSTGFTKTG